MAVTPEICSNGSPVVSFPTGREIITSMPPTCRTYPQCILVTHTLKRITPTASYNFRNPCRSCGCIDSISSFLRYKPEPCHSQVNALNVWVSIARYEALISKSSVSDQVAIPHSM